MTQTSRRQTETAENASSLQRLNEQIIRCRCCPRLVAYRERIARQKIRRYAGFPYWGRPVPSFGDPMARLLVVGLAPAAHGGNRTGRMFTGDRSADWLFAVLHSNGFANQPTSSAQDDGLTLQNCYITAAVHCAPPDNKPLRDEFDACRPYLEQELGLLLNVRVVVALGHAAFREVLSVFRQKGLKLPSPLPRFRHGATYRLDGGPILIASYHPSQQNTFTGRLTREMLNDIFAKAGACLGEP